MGYVIAIIALVLAAGAVAAVLLRRRGRPDTEAAPAASAGHPTPTSQPDPAPMTGLRDALQQVADDRGHTLGELIDAEASAIDVLRVTDDTGPLLRRVLDSVTGPVGPTADAGTDAAGETPAGSAPDA